LTSDARLSRSSRGLSRGSLTGGKKGESQVGQPRKRSSSKMEGHLAGKKTERGHRRGGRGSCHQDSAGRFPRGKRRGGSCEPGDTARKGAGGEVTSLWAMLISSLVAGKGGKTQGWRRSSAQRCRANEGRLEEIFTRGAGEGSTGVTNQTRGKRGGGKSHSPLWKAQSRQKSGRGEVTGPLYPRRLNARIKKHLSAGRLIMAKPGNRAGFFGQGYRPLRRA